MVSTLDLFDGDIHSIQNIFGGSQIETAHFAGEVQSLAQFSLLQSELVGAAGLGSVHENGAAGLGRSTGDIILKGNALGLAVSGNSSGQVEDQVFFVGILADADDHNIVGGLTNGNIFGSSIGGPSHIEAIGADLDNSDDLKVTHDLAGLALIHALDICLSISKRISRISGCGIGGCGISRCWIGRIIIATSNQAQYHDQGQQQAQKLLHD